jgi:hypothetical protein
MLFNEGCFMRSFKIRLRQELAVCLMISLVAPFGTPALAQQAAPSQQGGASSSSQSVPQAPVAQPTLSTSQPTNENQQSDRQQPAQPSQQNGNAPVGTAVAPYEKGVGVAASRPAGVVIAPAKQRRTRSLLIRVGLIVGAAVAVGTVIGLSKASPSEPSH